MTKQSYIRRPLFLFCLSFFSAAVLAADVSTRIKLPCVIFSAAISAALLFTCRAAGKRRLSLLTALLITSGIAGGIAHQYFTCDRRLAEADRLDGTSAEITATVKEVRYSSSYFGYYTVDIHNGSDVPDICVSLGVPDGSFTVGDVIDGVVTFESLQGSSSFTESTYFLSDGVLICAESEKMDFKSSSSSFSLESFFGKLNRRLTSRIVASSNGGELASAVLLGRRDLLNDSVKRDFSRTGISHLLAVSGIHLSLAVAALEPLLGKLRIKGRARALILCICVLFCMAITGFSKSVMRAGSMHILRCIGSLLGKKSDGLTSLGFAAVMIILIDPFSVYDTGFILSVLASYACIIYARYTKDRRPAGNRLKALLRGAFDTVKLTLLITGLTLPVMWKVFGSISLISPLTNVVFIPAVSAFLYLSLIYIILCGIPALNVILAPLLSKSEALILTAAQKISLLPHITVSLHGTLIGIFCVLVFITLAIATFHYKKHRARAVLSTALCTVCLSACIVVGYISASYGAELDYVTKGKSEGFSIRCGNSYVLIDASDGSSGFSRELMYAAENEGATELSALILTHMHRKHISSVASLTDNIIVRKVFLPEAESEGDIEIFESLCALLERRGIKYSVFSRRGDEISHDGIGFQYLGYTMLSRSTHPVVAFELTVGGKRFAYFGSSFGENVSLDDIVHGADTVFLGAHPPVRKKQIEIETDGMVILSQLANENELLSVTANGGTVQLAQDGSYHVEEYRILN